MLNGPYTLSILEVSIAFLVTDGKISHVRTLLLQLPACCLPLPENSVSPYEFHALGVCIPTVF